MAKTVIIEKIKEIIENKTKPSCWLSIYIQKDRDTESVFYKRILHEKDINVTCCDVATAIEFEKLITKDL